MSNNQTKSPSSNKSEHKGRSYFSSIGVIKVDWSLAGYPDVKKVAVKWSKDKDFRSIVVRRVSKDNFGIQFIYINFTDSISEAKKKWRNHFNYAEKEFGKIYAIDYDESSSSDTSQLDKEIIAFRPFKEA